MNSWLMKWSIPRAVISEFKDLTPNVEPLVVRALEDQSKDLTERHKQQKV